MSKRGAPSKPSPEPYVPRADSVSADSLCILCGDDIDQAPYERIQLVALGSQIEGPAHARCSHEYRLFAAQMPFAAALQTPLL